MKNWSLTFLCFLLITISKGQTLTVSTNQLSFGVVYENSPDSLPITINNNMGKLVYISGFQFYNFYGSPAFSTSQTGFWIADGGSQMIWVKFAPKHNIYHNSEMVILNNGQRGAVSVDLVGQGKYSRSYYDATQNLSEEVLKTSIQTITGQNYVALGYNVARDSMFMIMDNQKTNGLGATQNTLVCVYTGRLAIGYVNRTDCQTNDMFNTEHTWPQGLFGSLEPMKSDLHHLFPTDDVANNTRSSYPFGIAANPSWQQGGSKFDNNTNIFEPRDVHKGETARAMLYFVLRYQNYSNFLNSQEGILKTWNKTFLPANVEMTRNNVIDTYQHNRNPFVDYPQFADRIQSFSTTSTAPVVNSFEIYENIIDYGNIGISFNYIYSFIIINDGNQPLQLSNFNLSNNNLLGFTSGGASNTLAPGESYKTEINISPLTVGNINEQLTFNTNNPSFTTVQVPIMANAVVNVIEEIDSESLQVFPNPCSGSVNVIYKGRQQDINFILTNELGQPVAVDILKNNNIYTLSMQMLPNGFYILTGNNSLGNIYNKKLIKL